ncbi:bifunctional glutathione transferase/peroxidase [Recurvomyces mirabilis]|nr:bifunctional glutathione transferase/peroxidase [Recurvomyces mirabilis]
MAEWQEQPKIVLHWLNKSRAQRIVWLLQESKGLNWDIKTYNRGSDQLAPAELKKIHPLGKSPVITVETSKTPQPIVLAETGLITEYVCDYFAPHLVPKRYQEGKEGQIGGETEEWIRNRFFMHYAEGSLMGLLLICLIIDREPLPTLASHNSESILTDTMTEIGDNPQTPFFIKPITRAIASRVYAAFLTQSLKTHFTFLESQLATSPNNGRFLCGSELTAADIIMSFPLLSAVRVAKKITKVDYPKLVAYCDLLESQQSYKAAVKRTEEVSGEPYKIL